MPSLQAACSYMDQACCADSLNPNQSLQGNPKQRHPRPRLLTPLLKPKMNFRGDNKFRENVARQDKAGGSNIQEMQSHTAQFDSPQIAVQTQSSELCKCKTSSETRNAGTQTANHPMVETCDASTQCSFVVDGAGKATGFSPCLPPVDVSVQHPATGRQSDTAAEPKTHTPSPGEARSGGKHTPWSKNKPSAGSLSGSSVINNFTANNSDAKVILQRPINPFLNTLSVTDGRGIPLNCQFMCKLRNLRFIFASLNSALDNHVFFFLLLLPMREGRDERGQREIVRLMKDLSNEAREEVTSAIRNSSDSQKRLKHFRK